MRWTDSLALRLEVATAAEEEVALVAMRVAAEGQAHVQTRNQLQIPRDKDKDKSFSKVHTSMANIKHQMSTADVPAVVIVRNKPTHTHTQAIPQSPRPATKRQDQPDLRSGPGRKYSRSVAAGPRGREQTTVNRARAGQNKQRKAARRSSATLAPSSHLHPPALHASHLLSSCTTSSLSPLPSAPPLRALYFNDTNTRSRTPRLQESTLSGRLLTLRPSADARAALSRHDTTRPGLSQPGNLPVRRPLPWPPSTMAATLVARLPSASSHARRPRLASSFPPQNAHAPRPCRTRPPHVATDIPPPPLLNPPNPRS